MSAGTTRLRIAKCHHPVRGLGAGRRVGIWFQGCSIRCRGCVVPETWDADVSHEVTLAALLSALLPWLDDSDGVTISGGEPFDQPDALLALVVALRALTPGDVLVYSGYPWRTLQSRFPEVLAHVDVVVSEPFRASQRVERAVLVGSANQQVHRLSALGQRRYERWNEALREISLTLNRDAIDMAGILSRGELPQVRRALAERGWQVGLSHDPV